MSAAGRDVTNPSAIDHPDPPSRRSGGWVASWWFTVTGFFRFTYKYFEDVANGDAGTFTHRLIDETTGTYAAAVLFVAVVAFTWRYPLDRPGARGRIAAHIVAMVTYSAIHTTMLYASR